MRSAHESFLLAEARQRIATAEYRASLELGLTELRRTRPTLRHRVARLLVALAYRLSPEAAPTAKPAPKGCVQA